MNKTGTLNPKGNLLILSGRQGRLLKPCIMSTIKNHVQLIGNVGQEPTITNVFLRL